MGEVQLSIVIPTFNESDRIIGTLDSLKKYLESRDFVWEIVLSDDGSLDDTVALVKSWSAVNLNLPDETMRIIQLSHRGKGYAVRHGMLRAVGDIRVMCDADLAMSADQIDGFISKFMEGYDIVIGSREKTGARRFDEPVIRHIMGRIFNWYVRFIAVGGFQDTQCGYKCFSSKAAESLFGMQKLDGWCFDVEILLLARKNSMKIFELPIDWYHKEKSKVNPGTASIEMVRDTLLTSIRYMIGAYNKI